MGSKYNYLDLQLRDMDPFNTYKNGNKAGSIWYKFTDALHHYHKDNYFLENVEQAIDDATNELPSIQYGTDAQITKESMEYTFSRLLKTQIAREKNFMKGVMSYFSGSVKTEVNKKAAELLAAEPSLDADMDNYCRKFNDVISTLIKGNMGNEGKLIVLEALRSKEVAEMITAQKTYISSTVAVRRRNEMDKVQHEVDEYFEEAMDMFFGLNKTQNKTKRHLYDDNGLTKEEAKKVFEKSIKKNEVIFRTKFMQFIENWYGSNPKFVEMIREHFEQLIIDQGLIDGLFDQPGRQKGKVHMISKTKRKKDDKKGLTKTDETQIKNMLKYILRKAGVEWDNDDLAPEDKPLGISIHMNWRENENGYGALLQAAQDQYDKSKQLTETRKKGMVGKQQGVRGGNTNKLKTQFVNIIYDNVISYVGKKNVDISKGVLKEDLRSVIFTTVDNKDVRGVASLQMMMAFSLEQMQGLLGEIATAWAMKEGLKISNVGITGRETTESWQKHYDVIVKFSVDSKKNAMQSFGIQVKNYTGDKVTLYDDTSFSFKGNKIPEKYFDQDVFTSMKFILANGQFLIEDKGITKAGADIGMQLSKKGIAEYIQQNAAMHIGAFLRIEDMAEQALKGSKSTNSDIFVIGNRYIPSSYIIYKIYQKFQEQFSKDKFKSLIKVEMGKNFPDYETRVPGTTDQVVYIDKMQNSLQNFKVNFMGLTLDFSASGLNI